MLAVFVLFALRGSAVETWRQVPPDFLGRRFARFGAFELLDHKVSDGEIQIVLSAQQFSMAKSEILQWVDQAATAASAYYGSFPVSQVTLAILADGHDGVHNGSEDDGRLIVIKIGRQTRVSDLADDWQLTHEMFHLGFPQVAPEYHWMEEGLSTYLEPIARARVGNLSPEKVWRDLVEGLPQGLPQADEQGLDHTESWGSTYWGGALFWLLADVEIRERTKNQRSLDDAIRNIWRHGGNGAADWSLAEVLRGGDSATGVEVLKELHEKMGMTRFSVNLPALWKKLGVQYQNGRVQFDDSAPLAAVRLAITAPVIPASDNPQK